MTTSARAFARGWRLPWLSFPLALLALLLLSCPVCAQDTAASADEVKAAYIQKFLPYIEWPPSAFADVAAPLVVGVAGADALRSQLTRMVSGRPAHGRTVVVRSLWRPEQAAEVSVLFIGSGVWRDAAGWIAAVRGQPVAVITDAANGAELGALLAFVTAGERGDRIRFEASLRAAEQSGLKLSSRLLSVAERVLGQPQ